MSSTDALNKRLKAVFSNGRVEVGLEVGSDQGLSPEHYIQVPRSFIRDWAYSTVEEPKFRPDAGASADTVKGKAEWVFVQAGTKHVRIHKGEYFAVNTDGTNPVKMGLFHRAAYTVDDIKQFLSVNTGHVRDDELSLEQRQWVHAARFWAVAAGFVAGTKQREWTDVDDATDTSIISDDQARMIIESSSVSVTASAARAASWRKSNHATGGDIATGFARRWISKNAVWPTPADAGARKREQGQATTAFYVATHASCVHPVLAMMAPQIHEHWAQVDPSLGLITSWDVMESTSIRIAPRTQVAGAAIVVDSMVVLKMLVAEGLAPLLESAGKYPALAAAYKQVEQHGIRVAVYANWFLNGHPEGISRIPFAQKDSSFADLVGELAAVARTFYRNSTIGESMALDNAMRQMATETAKARWAALTKARKSASDETVMTAYTRIVGASSSTALQLITSSAQTDVERGVTDYNNVTKNIAAAVGVEDPVTLSIDRIVANMMVTPATSAASS
jgi:hypothetical protein